MKEAFDKHVYRILLLAALFTLAAGTIIFHHVEDLSYVDAYYFSVVTLATVGYGDITPQTDLGKIITTFYILVGVGIITAFISYTVKRRQAKMENRRKDR